MRGYDRARVAIEQPDWLQNKAMSVPGHNLGNIRVRRRKREYLAAALKLKEVQNEEQKYALTFRAPEQFREKKNVYNKKGIVLIKKSVTV